MTGNPLVSVIINCYNSEKYLRETIDSLIAQTYTNWEAIFWDNCSTDKTAEIIASYENPRFSYYLAEKNTPLGEARNLAMKKVAGEFFCFLDSDDVWLPGFLMEGINSFINHNDVVAFYSNYYIWKGDDRIPYNTTLRTGFHSLRTILNVYGIGMSACMVKTYLIRRYGIRFDPRFQLIEDLDFYIKIAEKGSFYYSEDCYYLYRVHDNSSSFTHKNEWHKEYCLLYDDLCKRYNSMNCLAVSVKDLSSIREKKEIAECMYYKENMMRKELLMLLMKDAFFAIRNPNFLFYALLGPQLYGWAIKTLKNFV